MEILKYIGYVSAAIFGVLIIIFAVSFVYYFIQELRTPKPTERKKRQASRTVSELVEGLANVDSKWLNIEDAGERAERISKEKED